MVDHIAQLIDIDKVQALTKVRDGLSKVRLASGLSRDEILKIEANLPTFKGVTTEVDPVRDYLMSDALSHAVGFVGEGQNKPALTARFSSPGCEFGSVGSVLYGSFFSTRFENPSLSLS